MGLMEEYINNGFVGPKLHTEMKNLINKYNSMTNRYLFVFSTKFDPRNPKIGIDQDDFYIIQDILRDKNNIEKLDFYIETPGGSGEASEEIAKFLRKNFEEVFFIVSGEAKSAGTVIVLSGDEIIMSETGSLGPIDAQMKIGRANISAFDYIEWYNEKVKASKTTGLTQVDQVMIAQISPGELKSVLHSLEFAKDLVKEWLPKYKFKNWTITDGRKINVTKQMKIDKANEIADNLSNHGKWRSHGRSLKKDDLEKLGLKIKSLEKDPTLADIIFRIQTICRLIFDSSSSYKLYFTKENEMAKTASPSEDLKMLKLPKGNIDSIRIKHKCSKCGKEHKLYHKLLDTPNIAKNQQDGYKELPKNHKMMCECGFEMDLSTVINDIIKKIPAKMI